MSEIAIIGAGPAGIAATIQLIRQGHEVKVFEHGKVGGTLWNAGMMENYPGFPGGITGRHLAKLMEQQLYDYIDSIIPKKVETIIKVNAGYEISSEIYDGIILCTGTKSKTAGFSGEDELANSKLLFYGIENLEHLANTTVHLPIINVTTPIIAVIAVLIFFGTVGKSAQFPLHVWLPDAMEGPTPVSAMIHAATMVSAGVFLMVRMYPLFFTAGEVSPGVLTYVAFTGAFTALFASTIALAQWDIKRVLAYSTISQLGFMIAALGVGAYVADGVFYFGAAHSAAFLHPFGAFNFRGVGDAVGIALGDDIAPSGCNHFCDDAVDYLLAARWGYIHNHIPLGCDWNFLPIWEYELLGLFAYVVGGYGVTKRRGVDFGGV